MGIIDTEEAAKRLARVILSDIELYHREKPQAGEDLSTAIEEGRNLFRSRVVPELVPLFATVLADRRKASANPSPVAVAVSAAAARPVAPERDTVASMPVFPVEQTPAPAAPLDPEAVPTPAPVAMPALVRAPAAVATPAPVAESAPVVAARAAAAEPPAPVATGAPAAARPVAASPAPRKGLLDTEEAAARLARVIVSDIQIYNSAKIAGGADLTFEINEGRTLFRSRVIAELAPMFEEALAAKGLADRRRSPGAKLPPRHETKPAAPAAASRTPVPATKPAPVVETKPAPAIETKPAPAIETKPAPAIETTPAPESSSPSSLSPAPANPVAARAAAGPPAAGVRLVTPPPVPVAGLPPSAPSKAAAPARAPVTPLPERTPPATPAPDIAEAETPKPEVTPAPVAAAPSQKTPDRLPPFSRPGLPVEVPASPRLSAIVRAPSAPAPAPSLAHASPPSVDLAPMPAPDLRGTSKARLVAVVVGLAAGAALICYFLSR